MSEEMNNDIIQFESSNIRRVWDDETKQWFFAVVDIVGVLTESKDAGAYWRKLKQRDSELVTNCHKFPMVSPKNNRIYQTDCADVEGMLRIIQSIPSPKAEPFKLWMARIGRERIEEIQDPMLVLQRLHAQYKAMGFTDEWITARLKSDQVSQDLLAEWNERGVSKDADQNRLLDIISTGTFGLSRDDHKAIKSLSEDDLLPDNMTDVELILKMFGEASTARIAQATDAQGYDQNQLSAQRGGKIAGDALKALEKESDRPVVTADNALPKADENDDNLLDSA